jgi:acetylornithine/succinyldiaminopimelate/putrescine aminotransferase
MYNPLTLQSNTSKVLYQLNQIRVHTGDALSVGLSDEQIKSHLHKLDLITAIDSAYNLFLALDSEQRELLLKPEAEILDLVQSDIINFYDKGSRSPYLPLAAKGAWIVSCYGAVIYDSGGYGMMGFGHNPDFLSFVLGTSQVMANIKTPNLVQLELSKILKEKIGFKRGYCPFTKFIFMNSGSEAMLVATRISDVKCNQELEKNSFCKTVFISLKGSFHGRTCRPAKASDSCIKSYKNLASFKNDDSLWTVSPNSSSELKMLFDKAFNEGVRVEAIMMEPVMGEGNPGLAITPEFYNTARELTIQHDTFLIVDSIQAGLRTHGVLSIVDYPGFEGLAEPDMETFSKAINAGQYPTSILAINKRAENCFLTGIYGNTMTANPRALLISKKVLEQCNEDLSLKIKNSGSYFLNKFFELKIKHPNKISKVQGTGLIISLEFYDHIKVYGFNSLEEKLRRVGINIIHGGKNSLRFTPVFDVSHDEIDLITEVLNNCLN